MMQQQVDHASRILCDALLVLHPATPEEQASRAPTKRDNAGLTY
jgi:hypothetical protein